MKVECVNLSQQKSWNFANNQIKSQDIKKKKILMNPEHVTLWTEFRKREISSKMAQT